MIGITMQYVGLHRLSSSFKAGSRLVSIALLATMEYPAFVNLNASTAR